MTNKEQPKISAIIAIHNGIEYTLKFLDSLKKLNYSNLEIIIVDDGSEDNSTAIISAKYSDIKILNGDGSFWWTKSMNVGFKYALENGADFVLVLNNDLEIDKNLVIELLECSKAYPNAIIGSKVYSKSNPDELFFGGGRCGFLLPPPTRLTPFGIKDNEKYNQVRKVDCLIGMGSLIPVGIFKEIGLYDEDKYPQYKSDVEFSMRAKKAGYKLIFCPKAILWNNTESSWKFPKKLYSGIFKDLLFHTRSPYLLKANLFYYYDYYPKFIWFISFLIIYIKCFAGIFLLLLKKFIGFFDKNHKENINGN